MRSQQVVNNNVPHHHTRLSSAPNLSSQGRSTKHSYLDNPNIKELLRGGLSVTLEEEPTTPGNPAVEEEDTIIKVEVKDRSHLSNFGAHPDNYSEYMRGMSGVRREQVLTFKKRVVVHQSPLVKACLQQVQNIQNGSGSFRTAMQGQVIEGSRMAWTAREASPNKPENRNVDSFKPLLQRKSLIKQRMAERHEEN